MMYLYNSQAVRSADERAIKKFGIPGEILMENAGLRSADIILKEFKPSRVYILAGPGNNGGDGYVIGRHLYGCGIETGIISSCKFSCLKGESKTNYSINHNIGIPMKWSGSIADDDLDSFLGGADLIIDCLLGTGSTGAPRGEVERLITICRDFSDIVSIDIPSGTDPDTGRIYDTHISAKLTVTMMVPKTGLFVMPGSEAAGIVEVVSLGLPAKLLIDEEPRAFTVSSNDVLTSLPRRTAGMHKGNRGCVIVAGGSREYTGASVLSTMSALCTGSGIVVTIGDYEIEKAVSFMLPEAISSGVEELPGPEYSKEVMKQVEKWHDKGGSLLAGPGMGRSANREDLIRMMWQNWEKPLVVDGDGLYWLSQLCEDLGKRDNVIVTPHEGEAAGLLGTTSREIRSNRLESAREIALRWGICILKGANTIIDDGKRTAVIKEGSNSLSVPGSGDVLSGCVSSLAAAGVPLFEAAYSSTWIHARCGDLLARKIGIDGVLARDIAGQISSVINELRNCEIE